MEKHFYPSKRKLFGAFILFLLFTAVSLLIIISLFNSDEGMFPKVLFSLIFLLFAFLLVFSGKKLFSNEPIISLFDHGLTLHGSINPGYIPYEDIDGVLPYEYQKTQLMGIIIKDEEKYIGKLSRKGKSLAQINQKTGFPPFNISLSYLKDPDTFIEFLVELEIPFFLPDDEKESV